MREHVLISATTLACARVADVLTTIANLYYSDLIVESNTIVWNIINEYGLLGFFSLKLLTTFLFLIFAYAIYRIDFKPANLVFVGVSLGLLLVYGVTVLKNLYYTILYVV